MTPAGKVVQVIARALADNPDAVTVTENDHRGTCVIELFMGPGELGRVIGRQGRTASALRVLAGAAAEREGKRVQLEFRDTAPAGRR